VLARVVALAAVGESANKPSTRRTTGKQRRKGDWLIDFFKGRVVIVFVEVGLINYR